MMEDIKKFRNVEKQKKWREEVQEIPPYKDNFARLNKRIHPESQELRLTDIKKLSPNTKLLRFVSNNQNKPLAVFRAGQYIGLNININGVRTVRPYSIVSSPNQTAYYELGIKRKEGGFVSPYILDYAKIGDVFQATEPLGQFHYNPLFHGKDLVFIAGGCGITPFMSMIRCFTELDKDISIEVLYGCLNELDILFREELDDLSTRREKFDIKYVLSEAHSEWGGLCGFITKDIIEHNIKSFKDKFYYICGSKEMYKFILKELDRLLIPRHRIIFEAFGVPDDVSKIMGWPMSLNSSNLFQITLEYTDGGQKKEMTFEANCTEPLLNSIERQKDLPISIKSGCRSGICALCRTKLLSGEVFIPPDITIREVDNQFGYIHPCISYPITDLHLDLKMI
ncbi:MAG: 2Fe-2S iron-sulfur cluster binding domain-containing protein [Candidatus Lokiarchaeota archaeon]|nr:2Fe-2S iron-sulfur cluster binding domain-containing protein [Candidatus Lokiarchaeota archaeon]